MHFESWTFGPENKVILEEQEGNFQRGKGNFHTFPSNFIHSVLKFKSKMRRDSHARRPCCMKLFAMSYESWTCIDLTM